MPNSLRRTCRTTLKTIADKAGVEASDKAIAQGGSSGDAYYAYWDAYDDAQNNPVNIKVAQDAGTAEYTKFMNPTQTMTITGAAPRLFDGQLTLALVGQGNAILIAPWGGGGGGGPANKYGLANSNALYRSTPTGPTSPVSIGSTDKMQGEPGVAQLEFILPYFTQVASQIGGVYTGPVLNNNFTFGSSIKLANPYIQLPVSLKIEKGKMTYIEAQGEGVDFVAPGIRHNTSGLGSYAPETQTIIVEDDKGIAHAVIPEEGHGTYLSSLTITTNTSGKATEETADIGELGSILTDSHVAPGDINYTGLLSGKAKGTQYTVPFREDNTAEVFAGDQYAAIVGLDGKRAQSEETIGVNQINNGKNEGKTAVSTISMFKGDDGSSQTMLAGEIHVGGMCRKVL